MVEVTNESVRLSKILLETYREWAAATGRTLSGTIERVLHDAAQHYMEGSQVGLSKAREAVTRR